MCYLPRSGRGVESSARVLVVRRFLVVRPELQSRPLLQRLSSEKGLQTAATVAGDEHVLLQTQVQLYTDTHPKFGSLDERFFKV